MCEINGERLLSRIQTLGRIGFQDKTGTTRLSYSPEYQEGRRLVEGWMREAGLQTQVDPVGNLTGRTPGRARGSASALIWTQFPAEECMTALTAFWPELSAYRV